MMTLFICFVLLFLYVELPEEIESYHGVDVHHDS